ncbi:hypothetical protein AB4099_31555 [Bosea sp. 2KB_26]|uniref:hypothetical protein n=1 Tax=Bosea sp. 2KB_26 TaxID=3237475 RepID=UPI003F905E8B
MTQATKGLPGSDTPVLQPGTAVLNPLYFIFLAALLAALNDRIAATSLTTSPGAPGAADIPSGDIRIWKNTGAGTVRLYVNDGGTLKSVLLN